MNSTSLENTLAGWLSLAGSLTWKENANVKIGKCENVKNEKIILRSLSFSVVLLFVAGIAYGKETVEAKAARIHNAVLTIDTHSDTPLNLLRDGFDIGKRQDQATSGTKVDFPG